MSESRILTPLLGALLLGTPRSACAYRPFDGTDAAVTDTGMFELELGPAQYYRRAGNDYLIAPAAVLNLGFAANLEAVIDLEQFIALEDVPGELRVRVLDTDALLKWVFLRGRLQDEHGLSAAIETGPLLPEIHGEDGLGFAANVIFSHAGSAGAAHLNTEAALSRLGNLELFGSIILEAPRELTVRPVAELFAEREFEEGSTYSALAGAIWPASESFTFDGGIRFASEEGRAAIEVRGGVTWVATLWSAPPVLKARRARGSRPQVAQRDLPPARSRR
jgi:hypothetical protein